MKIVNIHQSKIDVAKFDDMNIERAREILKSLKLVIVN